MNTVKLPTQGTVFDYYLDLQTRRFLPWSETVPVFDMEPSTPLQVQQKHGIMYVCMQKLMQKTQTFRSSLKQTMDKKHKT